MWHARRRDAAVRDVALIGPVAAAAAVGLVLALTVFKRGSYIDVLLVAEPPLLALAVCGAGWLWQRTRAARPVVLLIAAWLAVQSLSILVSPSKPWAAKRLGAASGLAWTASPSTVDHLVKSAQACPAKQAYSGTPYIAFLAGRRVPGDQADTFMIEHASANAASARRAAADTPTCPAPALSETDATSAPG